MAKSLNAQEEVFAQAMAAGKGPSSSYREAYPSKMGAKAVAANAKRVLKRPHVRARIDELQKESGESKESAGSKAPENAEHQQNPAPNDADAPVDGKAEPPAKGGFLRSIVRAHAREGRESSPPAEPDGRPAPAPGQADKPGEPPKKAPEEPNPGGRPTAFSEDLATEILPRLAAGEPLRTICRDEGMPAESTVRAWALDPTHPIADRYARAREVGFWSIADEILEIADDSRNDFMDKVGKSGDVVRVVDEEAISRSRLRIAARQWMLAKALPKTFGDKLEHSGGLQLEDITPRPQHPGRDVLEDDLRKFREAVRHHHARVKAEEAQELLPPAGAKANGTGRRGEH